MVVSSSEMEARKTTESHRGQAIIWLKSTPPAYSAPPSQRMTVVNSAYQERKPYTRGPKRRSMNCGMVSTRVRM